jgi:DNA modification methylase
MQLSDLKLEHWPTSRLTPYARNPRKNDHVVDQMAAAITEFGFRIPIIARSTGDVVDGHLRLKAALRLGLETVPVILADDLTPMQIKAFRILANRSATWADWDDDLLRLELEELQLDDFDIALTGFDDDELLEIMAGEETTTEGHTDEDAAPEVPVTPVSKPGDVWIMGPHRLLCGDSTDAASYTLLMAGEKAHMVVTDPPYGVNYANSAKDKLRGTHRPILNDNLGEDFEPFLKAALTPMIAHCQGAIYIAMSSSELDTLQSAFRAAGGKWSTFIIWAKNTFTLGRSDYQRQYEPILYGWPEGASRHWCGDRDQGDVWHFNKPQKNDLHPCLCPGSEVLTENGWRSIESLIVGDRVLAADGMFRAVEFVSKHFTETSVFRLSVMSVDYAVDATGNHPFLVLRDGSLAWIEASHIIEGDEICSPAKAMSETGTAVDSEWNTTSCGNETSALSRTGIASITSTTISRTITFQTCNLSPTLSTSGFTPVASCAMAFGGSPAMPAEHLNRSFPNTGISTQEAIPTDGAADPAMSVKSYSFVLRSVSAIEKISYSGLVWNLSVKDSPTFQTRIGMSHNTMKPVELVERAIRNSSRPGDVVLDPFGGSGTTLIAAEKSGRQARLIELDPKYVDTIVRRWQDYAGAQALREADRVKFDDLVGTADAADASDVDAEEVL